MEIQKQSHLEEQQHYDTKVCLKEEIYKYQAKQHSLIIEKNGSLWFCLKYQDFSNPESMQIPKPDLLVVLHHLVS